MLRSALRLLAIIQAVLGARVLARLVRTAGGVRIREVTGGPNLDRQISVLVPVLDGRDRLGPCLDGLIAQGSEVGEILVIDGGSVDGTAALVCELEQRDGRVK